MNPQEFDVELVPIPGAVPMGSFQGMPGPRILGLARRDWLLLGIGAIFLTLAVFLGVLLAPLLRSGS
jgi:hypothetical protein